MMAIVSKAVFEKSAPKAKLGGVLGMKVYRSASKHLERLDKKSRLFLVTVRPPDEALWLVSVLESPEFDGEQWSSKRNLYPVTDISALKGQLKFESGKGIQAAKGALGMSLQTPRVLTAADAELLLKAASESQSAAHTRTRQSKPVNVTAHQDPSALPCLCWKCLPAAPETFELADMSFVRAKAEQHERLLWFWIPGELQADLSEVVQAVQSRMRKRLKPFKPPKGTKGTKKAVVDSDDDDDDDDEDFE